MSEFNITVPGGSSVRLLTGGKFCPENILVSAEGGGTVSAPVTEKDVNFYDYDGTLLYSYTLEEAQALTELPAGPDWHEELVFQKWNWTLEEVNALTYQMDIGTVYDTDDGATHLHISIDTEALKSVSIWLSPRSGDTGYIDWGDGTEIETVSITEATQFAHEYPALGEYNIRLWSDTEGLYAGNGSASIFGDDYSARTLLRTAFCGSKMHVAVAGFSYNTSLEYVTLGPNNNSIVKNHFLDCNNLVCAHISGSNYYSFMNCRSLRIVTVSSNTGYVNAGQFRGCTALKRLRTKPALIWSESYGAYDCYSLQEVCGNLRSSLTSAFQNCASLRKVTINSTSTGLAANIFYGCYVLQELDLPETITTIGAQALWACYSLSKIVFHSTTPPTVANANAFTGIPTDCVVEVPADSLTAYQEATNYASIAAQMVGV